MRIELVEKETKLVTEADSQNGVDAKTQREPQRLDALLAGTGATLNQAQSAILIRNVACDSRKVRSQGLFFALQGAKEDGAKFARDAVSRGGVVVASEAAAPALLPESIAWIQVPSARKALATAAANFYGHPANALQLAAVTGTNGKTTTTSLVDAIVKASGAKTGLFGTIAYHTPLGDYPAPNTTPESVDLQGFFAEIRDAGGKFAVLEASSHSLMMDRLWGCHFQAAVFTNLTHEHMDFHKTFEEYFAAKRRLFEGTGAGPAEVAILNADDEYGPRLAGLAKTSVSYGIENSADISAKKFQLDFSGLTFMAHTPNGKLQIVSSLVGRINVYNILAAVGASQALGLSNETIQTGIRNLASVSGRFQQVALGQPFLVIVDYAHTDDALQNLIRTARELNPKGRVITLFGCGGGKDRTKRPVMGEVAGRLSDLTILTNDNPRQEDPLKIISDVVVGLQKTNGKYLIEPDREKAISMAIDEAREGDIVLLAGKGHEDYQVIGETSLPWDDREQARKALRDRGYGEAPLAGASPGTGFGT